MAYDSAANKDALYRRQGERCAGCLLPFPLRNLTVDHIVPQSKGGGHGIGNLQLLCAACNSLKGAGTHEELSARLVADDVIVALRSLPLLRRHGKYAPATGRRANMGPVAAALLTMLLPYAVMAAEKYGPGLAAASKPQAKRAGHAVAAGARKAQERAKPAGHAVAEGARKAQERAKPAGHAVAEGARKARERARPARHAVAEGARKARERAKPAGHAVAEDERTAREWAKLPRRTLDAALRLRLRSPIYPKEAS